MNRYELFRIGVATHLVICLYKQQRVYWKNNFDTVFGKWGAEN